MMRDEQGFLRYDEHACGTTGGVGRMRGQWSTDLAFGGEMKNAGDLSITNVTSERPNYDRIQFSPSNCFVYTRLIVTPISISIRTSHSPRFIPFLPAIVPP